MITIMIRDNGFFIFIIIGITAIIIISLALWFEGSEVSGLNEDSSCAGCALLNFGAGMAYGRPCLDFGEL